MPTEDHDRSERHRSSRHDERDGGNHHHRDRERGDRAERYGRRGDDRRDRDRDRDRDRRDRDRDRYRDYDDRPPRRAHHDDDRRREHRGGRDDEGRGERRGREERGGGGGGGGGGGRGRKDGLGTPERRSPTPEGAVPLSQRRRKASGWDVHAPGYEQYTAMQAKQTGLFNLPGANRTQIPPILGIPGLPPPMPVQTFGMGIGSNPNLSRQSRRLYIGSITPEVTEQNLAEFFNQKMAEMNIGTGAPGNPVLAVQCNYEKNYAFVEFRSAEDATSAMAFDGIIFINGPLKIRRPKDYGGDMVAQPNVHVPGVVSTNVPDSINKVFVGGLPTYLNEENVMELLKSFGELKAFNLVRENGNGPSKGFAFFEYVDPNVTDVAIQSLNGMELGDRYLVVQRASVGAKPGTPGMIPNPDIPYDEMPEIPRPIMPAGESAGDARILLMLNMVTPDDLVDDEEYGDLYEDVKEECSGFGKLEDLRIPRPIKKDKKWAPGDSGMDPQAAARADEAAGVGRVYVKYVDGESAAKALKSLAGRSFAGRSIVATLLSEDSQTTPPLNLIFAPQPEAPPPLPSS
ncbi:rrna primary transcript binding protein [Moniliophthora roreri MCA 2997]|uniref:Splicing factor U2AF subunit n=1 Tax=Moniliophthora roreri (strain MCA 2997) TaxID=1381753 RepID=V2XQR8_MONRO|nr:rrna primary transcript binding protein [Moniliophthora roreri MCA 2997]KAI3619961.1 rrna primary transcript binding protein [Moniliophthora roreri]